MTTGTIARRRFSLGRLPMAAALAGLVGVAMALAVAMSMFLNPIGEARITDPARWVEARQRHLELEYSRPAVNPPQWVEQQNHLQREYAQPAVNQPLWVEQQNHLQREHSVPATNSNQFVEQQKHLEREYGR